MTTRIETKQDATVMLSTRKKTQLFAFPGNTAVYQYCYPNGVNHEVHCLSDACAENWGDREVIPITHTDLVDGEWRVKPREPAEVPIGDLVTGTFFCWKLTGNDVYQTGTDDVHREGEASRPRRYWNLCYPGCENIAKAHVLAIPLKPKPGGIDPDGTIVFTEL